MRFNICMITTGSRPRLLEQSLRSLRKNAANWDQHALAVVMDGCSSVAECTGAGTIPDRIIINPERQGASRSRNIGASSTPTYLRKDAVMFLDDDVYCSKGWDTGLGPIVAMGYAASCHAHPFNHTFFGQVRNEGQGADITNVLSSVHIACAWAMWDSVGFFTEPGGPGGSEDVDWCKRASAQGHSLAVTVPQWILHTGEHSSTGREIVGYNEVVAHNRKLLSLHKLHGKVLFE